MSGTRGEKACRWRLGLAVSGGADSTALLVLMAELREALDFEAVVLHVDHGLRSDSGADAAFVKKLSRRLGLPFRQQRAKVVRKAGESLEMAARRVRLDFFGRMTRQLGLDAIATGHHADDVAETFILRMARGAGPEGLAGLKRISHVNGITFIRPLLDLRDRELRAFLRERGIDWREDSTNGDVAILRNRVRHVILPFLREHLDERITEHLCKSAAILRGELVQSPPCQPDGGTDPDGLGTVPGGKGTVPNYRLTIEGTQGYQRYMQNIGGFPSVCELSREALAGRTLELRPWRAGDRIAPIGMGGKTRKLQDVFVTAKVPTAMRKSLPVLVDAQSGEVLWVPGYRIAESVAVTSSAEPSWRFILSAAGQS